MLRIPKSVGSGTLRALYGGLPARNRKLVERCENQKILRIEKNRKKIEKIDFFESVKKGSQGSQSVPGTVLG